MNAFYVRGSGEGVIAAVRRLYRRAPLDTTSEFVGVDLATNVSKGHEVQLRELSRELQTDVILLSFQSVVDAFQFHHWRSGDCLRSLVYGCGEERTWERVEGTPEPWEAETFFDPEDLEEALEDEDDQHAQGELRRIWRERALLVGEFRPVVSARKCARKVAVYYRLPHYA